ncbi:hypothetical protein ABPG72_019748 [Tetrahymena utriculariae]
MLILLIQSQIEVILNFFNNFQIKTKNVKIYKYFLQQQQFKSFILNKLFQTRQFFAFFNQLDLFLKFQSLIVIVSTIIYQKIQQNNPLSQKQSQLCDKFVISPSSN